MDLKILLKEKGLTKVALSKRMGIAPQNFNLLLRNPTERTITKLANAIGCETWELLASAETRQRVRHSQGCTCPKCGTQLHITLLAED